MPIQGRRCPAYRLHKSSGQARVIIDGKHIYLGRYGTPESKEKYHRLMAERLASGDNTVTSKCQPQTAAVSVNELILAFWGYAEQRYVKNGEPTSEIRSFRTALRPVHELYGLRPVTEFGPLALVACRQTLIDDGICRKRINQHVTRIRQVFKWGVSRELVPETVWRALCSVQGLRRGEALETEPVRPAPEEHIAAVESYVTPQIWAMVNLQLWTGCRPGEACQIRTIDLNMQGPVWEYRPGSHKTEHHEKERMIYLGPHAQEVIKPWLKTDLVAHLFSPREAVAWYRAQKAKDRKSKRSTRRSTPKRNPKRVPGECYKTSAYDHSINVACKRAGVPSWSPNQLRHNAATRIRSEFGLEASRIILGHSSAATTELYAEIDRLKAKEIMGQIG